MADRRVTVKLELDVAGYLANLRVARQATRDFADGANSKVKDLADSNKSLAAAVESVGKEAESSSVKHVKSVDKVSDSYRRSQLWVVALQAAIANLPAIVAPAVGLLLAVPGAIATAGVAAGTLALSFEGIGKAVKALDSGDVKKIAEDWSKLSPAAREFTLELRSVRGEFNQLQQVTQETFFRSVNGGLTELARETLPALRISLPLVAQSLGDVTRETAAWVGQADTIRRIHDMIARISDVIRASGPLISNWGDTFIDLSNSAMPFLQRLLGIVSEVGRRFDSWVVAAQATGQLDRLFETTANVVEDLLVMVGRLADALFDVLASPGTENAARVLTGILGALLHVVGGLLDVIALMPDPLQSVVLVLIALAGVAPLVSRAFESIGTTATAVQAKVVALKTNGFGALMGAFGGPWGLAITGATIGLGLLGAAVADQQQKAESAREAYLRFGEAVKQVQDSGEGSVGELIRHDKAIQDLIIDADRYGLSSSVVVSALTGERSAVQLVNDTLRAKREELTKTIEAHTVQGGKSGAIMDQQAMAASREAQELDKLIATFNGVASEQERAALATDLYNKALDAGGNASRGAASGQKELLATLTVLSDQTSTAAMRADALKASMEAMFGPQMALVEAEEKYATTSHDLSDTIIQNIKDHADLQAEITSSKEKHDQLSVAIAQNKLERLGDSESLDMNSEAGHRNRDAIEAILISSTGLYLAEIRNGGAIDEATVKHNNRIDALRREAERMGLNKQETEKLIKIYGQVPTSVYTDIRITGIQAVYQQLQELEAAQLALKTGVDPETARKQLRNQRGFGQGGFATGGPVIGPGGPTEDAITAQLSAGEHVWTAEEVAAAGGHAAMYALRKVVLHGKSPKVRRPGDGSQGIAFASGGPVQTWPFPVTTSMIKLPTMADIQRQFAYGPGWSGPISSDVASVQRWIRSQAGKPYIWAGGGPGGYDCSGAVGAVWLALHGRGFGRGQRVFSTSNEAGFFPKGGWGMFTAGWANPGERGGGSVGHTAGNLAGLNFESRGGDGFVVGGGVTPVNSFAHVGHFDRGGWLKPGALGVNSLSQPEAVLTPAESAGVKAMAGGGGSVKVAVQLTVAPAPGLGSNFERALLDFVARSIRTGALPTVDVGG